MASESFRRSYFPLWVELPVIWLAKMLYRVRVSGADNIPAAGGFLLLPNHLSYVDVLVLQLACPRRLRFVGFEGLMKKRLIRLIFEWSGTIPIDSVNAIEGVRRVVRALAAGEAVCVFPESSISRTGQLMRVRRGYELMARRAGVPVVPAGIDGLWGSVFSFSGHSYIFKSPRVMPTPVSVCFGAPICAEQADTGRVRRALLDLIEQAYQQRPVLARHLGGEVVRSLAKRPRSIQVIDRSSDRREFTAGQLLGLAAALSRRIRKTIPERRVGVVLPPSVGAFIANIAIVCAGKIPVNLNFTAGRSSLESSLRVAGIRTVFTVDAVKARLPNFPWPEHSPDVRNEIAAAGKVAVAGWTLAAYILPNQLLPWLLGVPKHGDGEEAGLLFTSGSSGEPKGVALSHRNVLANCWQISCLSILPGTATIVACLPVFHSFGFTVTTWYPLLRGCCVVTVPGPLDTRKIVDAIRDEEATVLVGAPTFLRPLLKRAERGELRSLHLVVSGAERLPEDLQAAYMERFHIEIMQGYGLTETSPVLSVNQYNPPIITSTGEHQDGKRAGSVGRLVPGIAARIVDPDTLVERALTDVGLLLVRGANIFGGYLDDPEKTSAAMLAGWFVTGDLARFDDDGFLFIEGRLSRFSKIGGEMVPHGTVEQKILDACGWSQAESLCVTIVGVPDAAKGEALVLLTTQEVTVEQIRAGLLAAGVPALWVPKTILRVAAIPMLGTGKIDLKACRVLAMEGVT